MLSNDVYFAMAAAAQSVFTAAHSAVECYGYHISPLYKPDDKATAWMTFTDLDDNEENRTMGSPGLRGSSEQRPDIMLARYRLRGAQLDASATDPAATLPLTVRMRADKMTFASVFKVHANTNLGGVVMLAGQRLHIAHARGGPYDVDKPVRVELAWECTIQVVSSLV